MENNLFPKLLLAHSLLLIPEMMLLLTLKPMLNQLDFVGMALIVIITVSSTSLFFPLIGALQQRIILDLVDTKHRNSVYSLTPTLVSVFSFPLIFIAGRLIQNFGFVAGLALALTVSLTGIFLLRLSWDMKEVDVVTSPVVSTNISPS